MSLNSDVKSIFEALQLNFRNKSQNYFNDNLEKTVVVVPSLTLDYEILSKIKGHFYYEERMLCMLMLLKSVKTNITFVSSLPISPLIIDYYLHMLPNVDVEDCRKRLTLINCYDSSSLPLINKILNRPRLVQRIKESIHNPENSHLVCFNVTEYEMTLSSKLNIPLYGSHPDLNYLGSKSGCRKLFKTCGLLFPYGFEDIYSVDDICTSLHKIFENDCYSKKAVIKVNEGFSGDGNAIFSYEGIPSEKENQLAWIKEHLKSNLKIVAKKLKYKDFIQKIATMGGIVEAFLEGEKMASPSVQCRIEPNKNACIISTHDQVMGGECSQVFLGATFPANEEYAAHLSTISEPLAKFLANLGVLGRFGIDFMSIKKDNVWQHFAIEINLRKGGTTHPFLMLQFLTNGNYDAKSGEYYLPNGEKRFYFATDNIQNNQYKGLTPIDLLDIVFLHNLHYNHDNAQGVMFHLISALSQYGKIGLVSIADTKEKAIDYYKKVIEILNHETNVV
jgi:hypothetical protein